MHRINAIEAQLYPSPTPTPSLMHSISPHLLTHFTSHEEHDNHAHKLNKRAELDVAKREIEWHKLHSSIDTILPPLYPALLLYLTRPLDPSFTYTHSTDR